MTDYNDTLKKILAEKFLSGIKMEGLTKAEAARMLGFTSENYGTMACNPNQREKVPNTVWRAIQNWSNSRERIRVYSDKHGLYIAHKPKKQGRKPKLKPDAQETKSRKLAGIHIPLTHPDADRGKDPSKLTQDQEREAGAVVPPKNDGHWQAKGGDFHLMPKPGDEVVLKLRGEEIGRAVVDKVEDPAVNKPRIQDVPLDRLKVIFDAINDLKAMGYRVDINVYEKGS
jgi:hypothetical protein